MAGGSGTHPISVSDMLLAVDTTDGLGAATMRGGLRFLEVGVHTLPCPELSGGRIIFPFSQLPRGALSLPSLPAWHCSCCSSLSWGGAGGGVPGSLGS